MRVRLSLAFFLGAFVVSIPALGQFQQPTAEELKMTDDPKAPGADAVYLNITETTDDKLGDRSFYVRAKVLKEKGKELATVEIPYIGRVFTVRDVKGRTIHSDGTIVPLAVKPADLTESKIGDVERGLKVFTLPSVEVGSILEYYYQTHSDGFGFPPRWEIQRRYFVHKAHYVYTPLKQYTDGTANVTYGAAMSDGHGHLANNLVWFPQLPPGTKLQTPPTGTFILDVSDVPARPNEEWMPPIDSTLYKLFFYYSSSYTAQEYWNSSSKDWSKEVDRFAEPSGAIRQAVSGIVAPGDSDLDKAKKLYKAVQELENTDFTRKKGQAEMKRLGLRAAKRAEETWAQKSGSSEDISLLYLAMLRAAGLNAYAMKVVDRSHGIFAENLMEFNQLDDDLVILKIGDKPMPLDPGEKMCPFGMVIWKDTGAGGVLQSPSGGAPGTSPLLPYTANTLLRVGDLTLDERGNAAGAFKFAMTGQQALMWRQMAIREDEDEVRKSFDEWLHSIEPVGLEMHLDRFSGLDNPDANLVAVVKAQGPLGQVTAKRMLLPGLLFESHAEHPFVDEPKRLEPVDMHYAEQVTDQVVFHLPQGFTVEGGPQDTKVPWPEHAVFLIKSKPEQGQITITRSLARAFTFASADEYQPLREFYQKVASADQQQLVLAKAGGQ